MPGMMEKEHLSGWVRKNILD